MLTIIYLDATKRLTDVCEMHNMLWLKKKGDRKGRPKLIEMAYTQP